METPEPLSWYELQERLTKIMRELPPQWSYHSKDPCVGKILRLRDIAEWCGIERNHLYEVRRGERKEALFTAKIQSKLTWFFHQWDKGLLEKRQDPNGRWILCYRNQKPDGTPVQTDAGPSPIEAKVSWWKGTLTLKPKNSQ